MTYPNDPEWIERVRVLAEHLHTKFCNLNHADMCVWFYEVDIQNGENWDGQAHRKWFREAVDFIEDLDDMDLVLFDMKGRKPIA